MNPVKPGVKTSEFWLIVATGVAAILHAAATALGIHFTASADQMLMIAGACAAIYAALRTWLKKNAPALGNLLPDVPDDGSPAAPALTADPAPQPSLAESFAPPVAPVIGTVQATTVTASPFIGAEAQAA